MRKSHTSSMRHQEDKLSKATSSVFPIKMIAKLEWTQSNAQQNGKQFQNPTMIETISNMLHPNVDSMNMINMQIHKSTTTIQITVSYNFSIKQTKNITNL